MVSFSSLNMYILIISLKAWFAKPNNWGHCETVSIECLFSWVWITLCCFFVCLIMFCWKLDIIDNITTVTLDTNFSHLEDYCLFSNLPQWNLWNLSPSLCVPMMSLLVFKKTIIIIIAFIFKPGLLGFTLCLYWQSVNAYAENVIKHLKPIWLPSSAKEFMCR